MEPEQFRKILEGYVPDGTGHRLGRRQKDGTILHRPGRDITFSAPKSVSLAALIGGDRRIVTAHDKAVATHPRVGGKERRGNPAEGFRTTGRMVRAGGQKMVAATFRHDTSRNLDPQLHTHAVIANMLKGADDKWRTMANEKLYASKMLIGALYRSELAKGLKETRLRDREKPRRRTVRDRGRLERSDRGVLDPPRRDPGGDERNGAWAIRARIRAWPSAPRS